MCYITRARSLRDHFALVSVAALPQFQRLFAAQFQRKPAASQFHSGTSFPSFNAAFGCWLDSVDSLQVVSINQFQQRVNFWEISPCPTPKYIILCKLGRKKGAHPRVFGKNLYFCRRRGSGRFTPQIQRGLRPLSFNGRFATQFQVSTEAYGFLVSTQPQAASSIVP